MIVVFQNSAAALLQIGLDGDNKYYSMVEWVICAFQRYILLE
jgi:hypothetical protein